MKIKVVIGANYGDEGKGLATRYFTRQAIQNNETCKNVLFNGGAQRGHTVEMKDGTRHVFHHFGSGTYDGADTIFLDNFMLSPMDFVNEYYGLTLATKPEIQICAIDKCRVVTPYDIILNQIVELSRGDDKHGSCGNGIWETHVRYKCSDFNKTYGELCEMPLHELENYLRSIASWYTYQRLLEYGITDFHTNDKYLIYRNILHSRSVLYNYISDFHYMTKKLKMMYGIPCNTIDEDTTTLVCEGGQGLALDEDNLRMYPHVTASKTGAAQIAELCAQTSADIDLEVCYVTRAYFTRHGAGYFPTECKDGLYDIVDYTNKYNPHQGKFRYGMFDYDEFIERVDSDWHKVIKYIPNAKKSVMLTHLNEVPVDTMLKLTHRIAVQFDNIYTSMTKYAEDVEIYKERG